MRTVLKDSDSVTVQGWMVNELGLKGNSLLIYAIIYGYSQNGKGDYHGGYRYLAEFAGTHITTAMRLANKLVEDGLLTKEIEEINNTTIPHFKAVRRG